MGSFLWAEEAVKTNIYDSYDNYIGYSDEYDIIYDASGNRRGYIGRDNCIYGNRDNYLGFLRMDCNIESANGDFCGWVNESGEVYTGKTFQLYVQEMDDYNRIVQGCVSIPAQIVAAGAWVLGL